MIMTAGIAAKFKDKFGRQDELIDQKKKVGECAIINVDGRNIFYLVTKKRSKKDKPTLNALYKSVIAMKEFCLENGIKHIAMPKIGCGLDRLKWVQVKTMLQNVFTDSGINVTVHIWYKATENNEDERGIGIMNPNKTCKESVPKKKPEYEWTENVQLMGDSMIFNTGRIIKKKGGQWDVKSYPGIRMDQLTKVVKNIDVTDSKDKVVLVHVGTNNIKGWVKNGNVVSDTWELITNLKKTYQGAKISLIGIVNRLDVSVDLVNKLNDEMEWVVEELGGKFLDPNSWLLKDCLGKDGLHLNFKGNEIMAKMLIGLVRSLLENKTIEEDGTVEIWNCGKNVDSSQTENL